MKKLSQERITTVMLIWCLKQVKYFTLKFLRNGSFCWGKQKCAIYNTAFFPSDGGVDDVFVRLSLIKKIIKDVNLMCLLFSVKYLLIFWKSWMSLSNMSRTISNIYTYPFNPQLVITTKVENHDKKPKDQRNFYMWTITF